MHVTRPDIHKCLVHMRLLIVHAEAQCLAEALNGPRHAVPDVEEVELGDLTQHAATDMAHITIAYIYSSVGSKSKAAASH